MHLYEFDEYLKHNTFLPGRETPKIEPIPDVVVTGNAHEILPG